MNRSHARWYDICYTLLVVALVTAATVRTMTVTAGQLREPFDLVYETPNLRTVEMVRQGKPIYAPAVYDDVPYVFTMYPPLYHTIVAALPDDPAHPYLMGRLVACVAMAGATASLLFIGGVAELPAALLVIGSLWLFHPFTHLTAFLKSDSLGLLLAVVAVVVTGRGTDRRSAVAAAVL